MSTANRVIKNTGYLYAKMGVTMFISLYTTRLILNSLGATDFGIFNIVGGAIAMLGFLNGAMASATQRFMSYAEGEGRKDKQKKIFNVSVILHFLIALIVGVALLIAGYFFFNGILNIPADRVGAAKVVYGSLIISTMFTVMTVPYDAVINAHENMKYYALVGIVESLLKLAVAFAVVYTLSDKLVVYGILMACIPLITMSIMRVYCHKHYEECVFAPKRYWHKGMMKEMTSFAGWNFLGSVSNVLGGYGLGIVLNHFFGALLNAAQGIGNQLCGQIQVLSNTMLKAVNPIIAKSEGAGNRDLMLEASLEGCKFSYFLMAIVSIPALIEMPYVMKLWLGKVPDWAALFCQLQIIRTLVEQLTILLGTTIAAQGDIVTYSKIRSLLNILPLILTYVFFYYNFPPYWMYIGWILSWGVIGGIVSLFLAKKKCGLSLRKYLNKVLYPCLLITVLCSITGIAAKEILNPSIWRLITVCIVTFVTFLLVGWYIILDLKEKTIVLNLIEILRNKKR